MYVIKRKTVCNKKNKKTCPLLGAEDDAGHVEDDSQSHFSDLTQLLLLVGHADSDGIDKYQRIHALRTVLLTVEHGCAWLAAQLVTRQQEGTWKTEAKRKGILFHTKVLKACSDM